MSMLFRNQGRKDLCWWQLEVKDGTENKHIFICMLFRNQGRNLLYMDS